MKSEPSDQSELVSELLFGETYEVLEEGKKWLKIRSDHDQYEAWIDIKQHCEGHWPEGSSIRRVSELSFPLVGGEGNHQFNIPLGSAIPEGEEFHCGIHRFIKVREPADIGDVELLAWQYLHAPYRWGGRSPLGIDCSGFVQNIFLALGIFLPRDAYQQAEVGETIDFVEESRSGDLAYFDNSEGRITHVGIVIDREGEKSIIHASGSVRIDRFDHQGIFRISDQKYSHQLRLIKRVI